MNGFIDPFDALPGANMLCECITDLNEDTGFQARLIMKTNIPRGFMWLQPDNVVLGPENLFWRYVIDDPEERMQEAMSWFSEQLANQESHE
jgi:hypothetical protein